MVYLLNVMNLLAQGSAAATDIAPLIGQAAAALLSAGMILQGVWKKTHPKND